MGKFQKGHKLATGRPKDSISKRSLQFADQLIASGANPVLDLLLALDNAKECYKHAEDVAQKITANSQVAMIAEKMLPYLYPKLANIEVSRPSPLDGMTAKEKLEAMRAAVALLEEETKEKEVKQVADSNQGDCT